MYHVIYTTILVPRAHGCEREMTNTYRVVPIILVINFAFNKVTKWLWMCKDCVLQMTTLWKVPLR